MLSDVCWHLLPARNGSERAARKHKHTHTRAFRTDGALGGVLQTEGSQGPPGVKAEGNDEGSTEGFAGIFVLAQTYRRCTYMRDAHIGQKYLRVDGCSDSKRWLPPLQCWFSGIDLS